MKASQLIACLQGMDPDTEVAVDQVFSMNRANAVLHSPEHKKAAILYVPEDNFATLHKLVPKGDSVHTFHAE